VVGGPPVPDPGWRCSLGPAGPRNRSVAAHALPAGLWLHAAADRTPRTDDPAYAIPPDPDRLTVLIGRPGGRPVEIDPLHAALRGLPVEALARLRLVPYGPHRGLTYRLARTLAVAGRRVEVAPGAFPAPDQLRWLVDRQVSPWYPPAASSPWSPRLNRPGC